MQFELISPAVLPQILPQRLAGREWPARVSACKLFATAYLPATVGCWQPLLPLLACVFVRNAFSTYGNILHAPKFCIVA